MSDAIVAGPAPVRSIGVRMPLVDGPEKVSGKALYTADFIAQEELTGRILRSPVAHARIVGIDISGAEALPGVHAVVTGQDCADTFGVLPIAMNEYALARDRVRYRGEAVAAVAAEDTATAQRALDLIDVTYEELPAYFTADEARAPDAVQLHEERPGNLEREVDFELGDTGAGFAAADLVREDTFQLNEVCQVQSEPHAAQAEYDASRGRMTVRASTQVPYYVHLMLARTLGMEQVRHPRDQAPCRRRVRLPHRGAPCRAGRRAAGPQGARHGAAGPEPGRDLHHPSRAPGDRGQAEDRHDEGGENHRRRVRIGAPRRRLFRLRHRHDPLQRLDAVRDLRSRQRQVQGLPGADQHAAARRVPRPRHGQYPLRLRKPDGRDGGRARPRPVRGPPRQPADRAGLHRQRFDGELLRPAGMSRHRREGERLEGAQGRARPQSRARHGVLALHLGRVQAQALDRRAARDDPPPGRLGRLGHAADRGRRDRPGLVDGARAMRRRGARDRRFADKRRGLRQRAHAEGQRFVLVPRHLHGGATPRSTRPTT